MVSACKETSVSLVGGETAEMPDTYLPGEHDLGLGLLRGKVDREKIIDGNKINLGDIILGLPSNGLHTNGYSFARKLFFDIGGILSKTLYLIWDNLLGCFARAHINYTNHIRILLDQEIEIKGIAHITGGGIVENIPRILPITVVSILI
ncbi:MAG: hypothetical protein Ct9H90mP20_7630 [Candidatus Neomarinimicrobiota bacterium]|nr:MAG: hypothetical protein Ct9H90mP20_7630 [Candidatus Neomarinimicrobiota bacterium]